jgi:putative DNA primase/helicase
MLSNAFVSATGNNLVLVGDMTRRALLCSLDPKCERPELREFDRDVVDIAKEDRTKYVVAVLTVLRAYYVAGRSKQRPPLGSFGKWSRLVRDAMLWLGEADPVDTVETVRTLDPKLNAIRAVVEQWREVVGEIPVTAGDLVERAMTWEHSSLDGGGPKYPGLREALLAVAWSGSGKINGQRLGIWIAAHKDRVVDGCRIVKCGERGGSAVWQLQVTPNPGLAGRLGPTAEKSRQHETNRGDSGGLGGPSRSACRKWHGTGQE